MRGLILMAVLSVMVLSGCKTPQKAYFQEIYKLGVIPFSNPVSALATGTPLMGKPGNVIPMAPPTRCFPDIFNGKPTNLRWASDIIIPPTYKKMTFTFDANFNSLMAVGTPGVQFNLTGSQVQDVELEIREAQIEMIDTISLKEFYANGMSDSCKQTLLSYPFIMEALRVNAMSFSFFDSFGGKFNLTSANIGEFAIFGGDVQWYIEQGTKLVVLTPKYIGYKLAQLRGEDEGSVNLTSSEIKNGEYVWLNGIPDQNEDHRKRLFPRGFGLGPRKQITTTN